MTLEEGEGFLEAARVVHRDCVDPEIAHDQASRIHRGGRPGEERANLEVASSWSEHLEALHHRGGSADHLAHDVRAALRELMDACHPFFGCGQQAEVHKHIGTHPARELKPLVDAVDHDDLGRTTVTCHRGGVEAQPARALDYHAVPEADLDSFEAHDHLRQR